MATDDGAPWHAAMLEMAAASIREYPGGDNNPVILGWARHIGLTFPEMGDYANLYRHDATAWCGLTAAQALAKSGVRPPFGPSDTKRFLWAQSYADPEWGDRLDTPRRGCFVVFKWASGGGHVGTVDAWDAAQKLLWVVGGNQDDAVTRARFRWDGTVVGFFWPRRIAAAPAALRTPADVRRRMGQAITLAEARRDRQGNLAVYWLPANDGGGSYEVAGINERWHPVAAAKLKELVEASRFREAEDFVGDYTGSYTDVADGWTSSWGIEFYLRDAVFHRGPTGAARILQRALLLLGEQIGESGPKRDGVDGEVGPLTAEAVRRREADVERLLQALRQAREDYEREDVGYRQNFWQGFINRWNNQLVVARRFHAEQPKGQPMTTDQPPISPAPQPPQLPAFDPLRVSMSPEQENQFLRALLFSMMMRQGVQMPGAASFGTVFEPPPVQPPPPPPPVPVVPVTPAQDPIDKGSTVLGFVGLALSALGQATGWFPVVGESPTAILPPATGATLLTTGGIAAVGGLLNSVSPILGTVFRIAAGAAAAARSQKAAAPPQNPNTR